MRFLLFPVLFIFLLWAPLAAQYDYPLVINGLSLSLNGEGTQTIPARWFIANPSGGCPPSAVLIEREIGFMGDPNQPSAAADTVLVVDCSDGTALPVRVWWQSLSGFWFHSLTYVLLLDNNGECGCPPGCTLATPVLYNGLSAAYDQNGQITLSARDFIATRDDPFQDWNYAFSINSGDSTRTFQCGDESVQRIEIYGFGPGDVTTTFADTYLLLPDPVECTDPSFSQVSGLVINGLVAPILGGNIGNIPARAFCPLDAPDSVVYAFSENPMDTLFQFSCDGLTGTILVSIFLHDTIQHTYGIADTYFLLSSGLSECTLFAPPAIPTNDEPQDAIPLEPDCSLYGQTYGATAAPDEPQPSLDCLPNSWCNDEATATVWYTYSPASPQEMVTLQLWSDSALQFAVYTADSPTMIAAGLSPILAGELTAGNQTLSLGCTELDLYIQIDGKNDTVGIPFFMEINQLQDVCTAIRPDILTADEPWFPNPSQGVLSLRQPPSLPVDWIKLYNLQGQLVWAARNPGQQLEITGVCSGLYLLIGEREHEIIYRQKLMIATN